jgi:ATP-dependent Clp endopeptidase proteolytic subunit ClpP
MMETISQVIIPTVTETGARGERIFDIYSLLLRERIVFLGTPINDQIANLIIAQLLYLERELKAKGTLYPIRLYICTRQLVVLRGRRRISKLPPGKS